ncbi:hypothetical protein LQZ18_01250 [Lachnospiraceae bacterium ZAX-1]
MGKRKVLAILFACLLVWFLIHVLLEMVENSYIAAAIVFAVTMLWSYLLHKTTGVDKDDPNDRY